MTMPAIQRDSNKTTVTAGNLTLWFSYETLIAFKVGSNPRVVSENYWSSTTGKHLNSIDGGEKVSRVDRETFNREWERQNGHSR